MRRRVLLMLGAVVAVVAGVGLLLMSLGGRDQEYETHVTGVLHVNVNCSDLERSRRFYEMLGFGVLMDVEPEGNAEVAAAVGMESYVVRGVLMVHEDGSVIDLLQWQEPHDARPPYDKLNHLGLARIALTTTDIDADIARLKAEGVAFLSDRPAEVPDTVGGTTRFICFEDPDGTVIELVELGTVMSVLQRASRAAAKRGD